MLFYMLSGFHKMMQVNLNYARDLPVLGPVYVLFYAYSESKMQYLDAISKTME